MKEIPIMMAILFFMLVLLVIAYVIKYKNCRILERQLENLKGLKTSFMDAYTDLIYVKDETLRYIIINRAVELFLNKSEDEIIGKDDFSIASKEFAQKQRDTDLAVLEKKAKITIEEKWRGKIYRINKFPVQMPKGKYGVGAYIEDITQEREIELEKQAVQERIQYLSYHDSLTGLYNRRFFEEEINRLDTRRNLPFSVIVGDANGLKLTNDIFGHAYGDILIKKVADVIKRVCRADDIIARWGGDEFVILLPKTSLEESEQIINRIKMELSKESIKFIKGCISMGAATKQQEEENILEVLGIAEERMYHAKSIEKTEMQTNAYELMIETFHNMSLKEKRHAENVSYLCELMGRKLNLLENDIINLKIAGYLHDIGKVVLNNGLLKENDNLTAKESAEIKKHVVNGYRILNAFQKSYAISEAVLMHHENWDGTGYPKGLKEEEIPLLARIISIAAAYDKIVYDSNINENIKSNDALNILKKEAGTKYDPKLTEIFAQMIETESISI